MASVMGRPSKITQDIHDTIVAAVVRGNYIETAAALAGICKQTLYNWMKRGNEEKTRVARSNDKRVKVTLDEKPYVDFLDALKKALATAEDRDISVIDTAAQGYTVTKTRTTTKSYNHPMLGHIEETTELEEITTKRDWTAAAWKRERKDAKRWGKKQAIEVKEEIPTHFTVTVQDDFADEEDETLTQTPPGAEGADREDHEDHDTTDYDDDFEIYDDFEDDPIALKRDAIGDGFEGEFGDEFFADVFDDDIDDEEDDPS